ncbi:MAG: DinB family protein [Acidobacteria bacterium]|nr:DinB family protein [Acidobacteriota bacterium]
MVAASALREALAEAYIVNDEMNQLVLEHLDPRAWRAKPLGKGARPIVAIVTHMQHIRRKWIRLSAPHIQLPAELDRARCTQKQAKAALADSARKCVEMIREALAGPDRRVPKFRRDGWARPWPAGAGMFAYMVVHDAHHRGQVCMLAHQLGYVLPMKVNYGMWGWERLWKECGFAGPR